MIFTTTATLNWFNDGCCDAKYLDIWQNASLNFRAEDVEGPDWHHDRYEQLLGHDRNGTLFQAAADNLLRYHFYPDNVMQHYGTFSLDERRMQVGDRIVQRVRILRLFGRSLLDAVTMTEVTAVIDEPRRCGFTYATTTAHADQGEWTAVVEWHDDDRLSLTVTATSRPRPEEPKRNHGLIRRLQKRAHRLGIAHFSQLTAQTAAKRPLPANA